MRTRKTLLLGAVFATLAALLPAQRAAAQWEVKLYTRDAAPPTPKLGAMPLRESVSQHGITWTFAEPARVGRFVGGDWYVVGPVTVTKIDPAPRVGEQVGEDELDGREARIRPEHRVRNGSMLNPPARQEVAYDSGIRNWFRPALVTVPPVEMKPGDSLVSTISLKLGEEAEFPYHSSGVRGHHDNSPIRVAAVLTCLAEPQPSDAFRPGYCDREQTIYLARDLRRNLLPKLEPIDDAPDPVAFAKVFARPWTDTGFFGFDRPMENAPHYGQWVGQSVGNAALLLCMDFAPEQKEPLLVNLVQVGIDYWSVVRGGHPGWEGWGGHGSGHKLPIVLAGHLLGDERMASPTRAYPNVNFGEDNQTRYGPCWTGAGVVFAGHSGIHADGTVPRSKWGPYEHLHPKDWKNEGDRKNMQSEAYRRANTSCCWVAQALALRLMKLEDAWNHDAFFDYVDRWMFEDDTEHRKVINEYFPNKALVDMSKKWFHQSWTGDRWVRPAWDAWRTRSEAPTDGWKRSKEEQK